MAARARATDPLRPAFLDGRAVTNQRIEATKREAQRVRFKFALETIAKLGTAFTDPIDAANAAVRIAEEALK